MTSDNHDIIHVSYSTSDHLILKRKILQCQCSHAIISTRMLYDLSNKLSIFDESPQLLGQRALPAVILVARGRQNDVDA